MAEQTGRHDLVKFSDSDLQLTEPRQDISGHDVYDIDGEQIGSVEDLYVDRQTQEARFLDVGAGGFLGIGEKHFLIPFEAVSDISDERVTLNQDRDQVLGSPDFDADDVPDADAQHAIYAYYGYV